MKFFKIRVQSDKAEFFKQLLSSFDFLEYEEVEGFSEPRIYPAGNFEIHSASSSKADTGERKLSAPKQDDEGMQSIRRVISQIEEMRNKSRR